METPPSLRVGIIGCGNISRQYFTGMAPYDVLKTVAVADLDPARAAEKAALHGLRASTVEELLAAPDLDLVLNLTIPSVHGTVNREILRAGKHAYVEKPFAMDLTEAREVLELAKQVGLRVGCAPDTFLGGGLQTARRLLDDGVIGDPIAAVANLASRGPEGWHPDPEFFYQPGGGPMLDMGPYYLTALVHLLGPIRRVCGSARASFPERIIGSEKRKGQKIPVNVPTHYAGIYDFAAGTVATLNMSFDVWSHSLPIIEIYGSKGTLRVPDPNTFGGAVEWRAFHEKEWQVAEPTHSEEVGRGIGLAEMADAILKKRPHRASGELATHVLEAMQALALASDREAYVHLTTTVARPEALPVGAGIGQF